LQTYFSEHAVSAPAAWIRVALELNDEDFFSYLTDYSLNMLDKSVALTALNHERGRAQRLKISFPSKLEIFRDRILRGN
jgi:hypothetical protein